MRMLLPEGGRNLAGGKASATPPVCDTTNLPHPAGVLEHLNFGMTSATPPGS